MLSLITLIFEHLTPGYDLLRFLVKGDPLAGPVRRIRHDDGDGMVITRFYRGIRLFAAANAFHPVAHMRRCQWIGTRARVSGSLLRESSQRDLRQQVGRHT